METGDERVRRALAQLAADADSAPEVPAGVTDRIRAALREAPPPAAHGIRSAPQWSRLRIIGVVIGLGATAAALVIGATMALHSNTAPTPTYPTGPTADRITVSVTRISSETPRAPNAVVTRP